MDALGDDTAVLASAAPLDPADAEHPIVDRERIQSAFRTALTGMFSGDRPHLFVYGDAGVGKSLLTRRLLAEYVGGERRSVVIDCEDYGSAYGVAVALANALAPGEPPLARTGHSKATVLARVDERLRAARDTLIVLDAVDTVDAPALLEQLLDGIVAGGVATICVTSNHTLRNDLSLPVRRRLCARELVLTPYDRDDVYRILEQRATAAFREGALSPEVLDRCVTVVESAFDGDVGRGIRLLGFVALVADEDGATHVTTDHVTHARDRLVSQRISDHLADAPRHRAGCLRAVHGCVTSRDEAPRIDALYDAYRAHCREDGVDPISKRGFHGHLRALRDAEIVTATSHRSGTPGHYYRYHLGVEPSAVQLALAARASDGQA